MSQYMVAGMMFGEPDYLQHARPGRAQKISPMRGNSHFVPNAVYGEGSGAGRRKGSRNGFHDPRAAYKGPIVGKVAGTVMDDPDRFLPETRTQALMNKSGAINSALNESVNQMKKSAPPEVQRKAEVQKSIEEGRQFQEARANAGPRQDHSTTAGQQAQANLRRAFEASYGKAQASDESGNANQSRSNRNFGDVVRDTRSAIGETAQNIGQWVGDRVNDAENAILGRIQYTPDGRNDQGVMTYSSERVGGLFGKGGTVERAVSAVSSLASRAANTIGTAANSVKDWFSKAFGTVSRAVSGAAQAAGRWVGDRATDVGNAILGRQVEDVVSDPDGPDMPVGTYHREGGLFGRGGVADQAGRAVGRAAKAAGSWIQNAAGTAVSAIRGAASQAAGFASRVVQSVGSAANQVKTAVEKWVGDTARNVGNAVSGAAQATGQWVGDTARNVGNAVSGAAQATGQWVGDTARNVGNAVSGAAQATGQWFGDTARNVGNAVSGAAQATGQWFGDTARNVGTGVNNFIYGAPDPTLYPNQNMGYDTKGDRYGGLLGKGGVVDTARNVGGAVAGVYDQYIGQPIANWQQQQQRIAANNAAMPVGSEAYRNAFNQFMNFARNNGVGKDLTDQEIANIINREMINRVVPDISSLTAQGGLNAVIMNQISAAQAAYEESVRQREAAEFNRQYGLR